MFSIEQLNQIRKYLSDPRTETEKILNKPIEEVITHGYEIFVAVAGHGRTCFMSVRNFLALISLQIYRMCAEGAFTEDEALNAIKAGLKFYKNQDKERGFPKEWLN